MDVNALHKDELEFELACRGVQDCKTVATMRKFLREIWRREATGESSIALKVPKSCIDNPSNEIAICGNKLSGLVTLIAEMSLSPDHLVIKRIHSRLTHLANRTKLIIPTETSDIEKHLSLLRDIKDTISALDNMEQKEDEEEDVISDLDKEILQKSLGAEAAKIIEQLDIGHGSVKNTMEEAEGLRFRNIYAPQLGVVDTQAAPSTLNKLPVIAASGNVGLQLDSDAPDSYSRSKGLQRSSTIDREFHKRKLVPLKDWGVKFSGGGTVSINAFLERINELKEARNADDEDLFRYAIDLFEGEALIWFRANKEAVSSWSDLVELLFDTFQQPNYQEELLEEIKQRTQSKQESVVIYISVMQNMFNRLPVPLSELQKLIILRRNLQPYFQKEICRDTFKSVVELTSVLRVIERTKLSCESFREPVKSNRSLEQDLAYQGGPMNPAQPVRGMQSDLAAVDGGTSTQSKCWNCRSPGHFFRSCNLPRQRLFCYKCGRFGVTVEKCTCNKNKTPKGNDNSESMAADQTPKK